MGNKESKKGKNENFNNKNNDMNNKNMTNSVISGGNNTNINTNYVPNSNNDMNNNNNMNVNNPYHPYLNKAYQLFTEGNALAKQFSFHEALFKYEEAQKIILNICQKIEDEHLKNKVDHFM